jgi:hypothetical protein
MSEAVRQAGWLFTTPRHCVLQQPLDPPMGLGVDAAQLGDCPILQLVESDGEVGGGALTIRAKLMFS